MDLCEAEAVARAEADIRAINSSVPILRTTRCEVDLAAILHRCGGAIGGLAVWVVSCPAAITAPRDCPHNCAIV